MTETLDQIREEVENMVQEMCQGMTYYDHLPNLDRRAGTDFWVDKDKVITGLCNLGKLEYYGGFEYVEPEYKVILGDYVIFSRDHERVDNACEDDSVDEDVSDEDEEEEE